MQDNTIKRIHSKGEYRHEEDVADAAISPGNLIEITATGCKKQATADVACEAAFAAEDALQGKTVSDDYAAGDVVSYILPVKGGVVNAILKAGTNYARGAKLAAVGDGTLDPVGAAVPIAVVEKALDLSASAAVNTLCPVRIL